MRIIERPDKKRRAVIFRRKNETYGFLEEIWSDDPYEQCWIPRENGAICDSEETALKEATGRIRWLVYLKPTA